MSNSYKSVALIANDIKGVNESLVDSHKYYAHIPALSNGCLKPELLSEHTSLVMSYFCKLVEIHRLDSVIDNLINEWLSENDKRDVDLGNFIKRCFVDAVFFHDSGKINENFQADPKKMNNPYFRGLETKSSSLSSYHSPLSTFIFICKQFVDTNKEISKEYIDIAIISYFLLSYSIFKHHASELENDIRKKINFENEANARSFEKYLKAYNIDIPPALYFNLGNTDLFFNNDRFNKYIRSFGLYSLIRLNYSLLTASDYLATNEYMTGIATEDFGTLSPERIKRIYNDVSQREWLDKKCTKRNYNKDIYLHLCDTSCDVPTEKSGQNLNLLRRRMGIEVVNNIRKLSHSSLFYIEAPTGGGKSNLSFLAIAELLNIYKGELNKVFYVLPFTTLSTQTHRSIIEMLGLDSDDIIEYNSKAGVKCKEGASSSEIDAAYGQDKKNYIDNLFVNFPVSIMTHIKFFDIIKTCKKEANYLLHRLANSIVVIDELQSYNPKEWDKIIYFINKYATTYNIKFILMSATLPKLDRLNVIKDQAADFKYLLSDAKKNYFRNPNFCNRVSFDFSLLDIEDISLHTVADVLLSESEAYSEKDFNKHKPKGSVYTIIEFIFKKTASQFYKIITEQSAFFDEIYLLSGTILEHRRKEIINALKREDTREKKILLITTQVVEAGVDIDMDLGFKDTSLIDSDEQLAGRINRNINKNDCKLFLFNHNKESLIYGKDKRLEITKKEITTEQHKNILQTKDFDLLYDLVMAAKNEWNDTNMGIGFKEYQLQIDQLHFESVDGRFKLIGQDNISCFVPLNVPLFVAGSSHNELEKIFSDSDLAFMEEHNIFPNEDEEICGKEVFDLYIDIINNNIDFSTKRLKVKILQGIMSKFVFSLFASKDIENEIMAFIDFEKSLYGYKYLERWDRFYKIDSGMNDEMFHSNETQFL